MGHLRLAALAEAGDGVPLPSGLERKLLQLLSKELSEDLQDAASQLLEYRGTPQEVERIELVSSIEMRAWFQAECPALCQPALPAALPVDSLSASFRVHHCKRQDKLRQPISTSIYPSARLLAELLLSCPELVRGQEAL